MSTVDVERVSSIAARQRRGHKTNTIKYESEEAVRSALIEILVYICFVITATIVTLSARHIYMFYFNQAIVNIFTTRSRTDQFGTNLVYTNLATTTDWWQYMEKCFMEDFHGIHGITLSDGVKDDPDGTFMYNVLLGPPRLRQIRVQKDTCRVHEVFTTYFDNCYGVYSPETEETKLVFKGTKYHTLDELQTVPVWAQMNTYLGGGYVKYFTYDLVKNLAILNELKTLRWIDRGTRAVYLEFGLFNTDTNLFENVKLITEMPPTGGIKTSSQVHSFKLHSIWTEGNYFVMTAAVVFYFIIILNTITEIWEVLKTGIVQYIYSIWNFIDLLILIFSYKSFFYNLWHSWYLKQLLERAAGNPGAYQSLDIVSFWNRLYLDILALCTFLIWIKIFKFIRFNKTMMQFSTTLERCAKDVAGFGLMFAIVFLSYAQLGYLLFGTHNPEFRNFKDSTLTVMRMILGDFDYKAIEDANRVMGPIFFITYILLVFFILLNMFLAIINDTYSEVKREITHGENYLFIFLAKQFRKMRNFCCHCGFKRRSTADDGRFSANIEPENNKAPNSLAENEAEVYQSESLYPITSSDTATATTRRTSENTLRLRKSEVIREYFEPVPTEPDSDEIRRLTNRIAMLENVVEKLIGNMDLILKKVDSKKRTKRD